MLKLVDGSEMTEELKKAFEIGIVKQYLKLTDGTIIDSNNYLQSAKLEELRYHEDNKTFIGEAVARRVTVNLYNENNELDLENKEFEFFEGAQGTNKNLYNVFDKKSNSNQLFTTNNDGWVHFEYDNTNGTATMYFQYYTYPNQNLKTNTKYYFITETKNSVGSGRLYSATLERNGSQFKNTIYIIMPNNGIFLQSSNTSDDFSNSTSMLRAEVQVYAGSKVSIDFRISVFEKQPFLNTFSYVKYNQSLYEYINHGKFIVQKPENNNTKEKTEFEALDYMCKLNQTYKPRSNFSVYI